MWLPWWASTEVKGKIVKQIETFPIIVIIVTSILFVSLLTLNQNQTAIAQSQQQQQQGQALASKGVSFGSRPAIQIL